VSRRELANTLRVMRRRAGKTLEEAAAALEVSAATLSRIETGIRVPRARDVKDLCEFYGITDPNQVNQLTSLVAEAKESGWWEAYTEVDEEDATFIGLEAAATAIDQFELGMIPGFLQTADYGRAYLRDAVSPTRKHPLSEHDVAKRTEVKTRRQQLLSSPSGLTYTAVIDEAVVLRLVGGAAVMLEQVNHLLLASERPGTEVLMLPMSSGSHPGQYGGFSILSLPQTQVSDVVYIESHAGQLFLETPEELDRYRRIFAILRSAALDARATQEALHSRLSDLRSHL
jgi:transcriptional regulator with XRE-family HTH domain